MEYSEDYCSSSSSSSSSSCCSPLQPKTTNPSRKRNSGRKKFRETRHPVYHGVRQRGKGGKWVCELREPKKKSRIWLGTYPTPEMAARAHDVAAIALRGKAALLNFPNSAWDLPQPDDSSNADDIRRAAAKAAAQIMFHPPAPAPQGSSISPKPMSTIMTTKPPALLSTTLGEQQQDIDQVLQFVDDEAMFGMPALLKDMAEGMMLTPPAIPGLDWDGAENMECHMDEEDIITLWSF